MDTVVAGYLLLGRPLPLGGVWKKLLRKIKLNTHAIVVRKLWCVIAKIIQSYSKSLSTRKRVRSVFQSDSDWFGRIFGFGYVETVDFRELETALRARECHFAHRVRFRGCE